MCLLLQELSTTLPAPAGTVYYFACQRWFSRDQEDGAIERTLAASLTPPDAGKLNTYTAEVHTSGLRGAGTNASVALQLFGAQGNSGVQCLKVSAYTAKGSIVNALKRSQAIYEGAKACWSVGTLWCFHACQGMLLTRCCCPVAKTVCWATLPAACCYSGRSQCIGAKWQCLRQAGHRLQTGFAEFFPYGALLPADNEHSAVGCCSCFLTRFSGRL